MRNKAIHNIYENSRNEKDDNISFVLLYTRPENRAKFKGPKCLFEYKNGTILTEQIKEIRSSFKNSDIIVCTGIDFHKVFKEKTIMPPVSLLDANEEVGQAYKAYITANGFIELAFQKIESYRQERPQQRSFNKAK